MLAVLKIIAFTGKFWKWYIFMGCFVMIISLLNLAVPILSKQIVDMIMFQISGTPQEFSKFIQLLILIILTDILMTILIAVSQWVGDILTVRLQTYLSKRFYQHLLGLHIGFYDNEITGRIVNKMYRGISSITEFIQNMLNNFLPFFLTALVTIILLAKYSLLLAIFLTLLFPIYILISHKSTLAWKKYEEKKNKVNDDSQGRVFESIVGIRVVKSFAAEVIELASFVRARKLIEGWTLAQSKEWHVYDFARRLVLNVILFGAFAYIVYWTFNRRYTIGEMTLLMQLIQQARFPLFAMSFILGQIQQASAGSKDFFEILDTVSKIKDKPGAKKLVISGKAKSAQHLIEFKDVDFSYDKVHRVLKNISFKIGRNEKMALVGESGEGKSTIVNLLLRYYELKSGAIYISDVDIRDITQSSLHSNMAVVFQDSLLFSGTIMENIRYGKPGARDEEVIEASVAANAHEFIEKLPDRYRSIIGERGVKLSGGQKQRISIARAILKNAPIIILDEATSALDSKSELLVQKGLDKLLQNRTSIIIAHRLSTIASANHILVVSKGVVGQYGVPAELLKDKRGLYAQMVALQQSLLSATPEEREKKLKEFDLVG